AANCRSLTPFGMTTHLRARWFRSFTPLPMRDCGIEKLNSSVIVGCKSKESIEVLGGAGADFLCRHAAQFADLAGYFFHKCWFVAFSAMRNRCQVRRIGFDQHAVERHHLCRVTNRLRFGECDVAREGNHETHIERAARVLDASSKAVQCAA